MTIEVSEGFPCITERQREAIKVSEVFPYLTKRQREVLALTAKGLTDKEVARRLEVDHRTVENHWEEIHRRLKDREGPSNRISIIYRLFGKPEISV